MRMLLKLGVDTRTMDMEEAVACGGDPGTYRDCRVDRGKG